MERQRFSKKTVKQKKTFEGILNSYKKSFLDLKNLKDLHSLASQEKDEETLEDCLKKLARFYKKLKQVKLIAFYLGRTMAMIFISKYTLEQVVPKARIGLICFVECI